MMRGLRAEAANGLSWAGVGTRAVMLAGCAVAAYSGAKSAARLGVGRPPVSAEPGRAHCVALRPERLRGGRAIRGL